MHIQLDAVQPGGGWRNDHRLGTAGGISGKVETGCDRELGDGEIASQRGTLACPVEAQVGSRGRTDPWRVTQADVHRVRCEVEVDLTRVGGRFSGKRYGAAPAVSHEVLDLEPVLVEN